MGGLWQETDLKCMWAKCHKQKPTLVCPSCGALCEQCAKKHHGQGIDHHKTEPLLFTADIANVADTQLPLTGVRYSEGMDVNESLFRYNRWLALRHRHLGTEELVVTDDIEAMLQCHMLCPVHYAKDMTKIFGAVLPYNGHFSVDNEEAMARGYKLTEKLWEEAYGEPFDMEDDGPNEAADWVTDPPARQPQARAEAVAARAPQEMSVAELKAFLKDHNVSSSDCFEKADLVAEAQRGILPSL